MPRYVRITIDVEESMWEAFDDWLTSVVMPPELQGVACITDYQWVEESI